MSQEITPCDGQNVWCQTDLREAFLFCKCGYEICKVHKASPGRVQWRILYPTTFAFDAVPEPTCNIRNRHDLVTYFLNMLLMKPISVFAWVPPETDAGIEIRAQEVFWRIMPVRESGSKTEVDWPSWEAHKMGISRPEGWIFVLSHPSPLKERGPTLEGGSFL